MTRVTGVAEPRGGTGDHVDVLPGLKAGASTPPDGSAVAPAGPRPFLPALNGGVPRAFLMGEASCESNGCHGAKPTDVAADRVRTISTSLNSSSVASVCLRAVRRFEEA